MSVVAQSPFTAGTKRLFDDDENDAPRGGEGGGGGGSGGGAAAADPSALGADGALLDGRCKRVRFAAGSSPARAAAAAAAQHHHAAASTAATVHPATFAALCALFPGMDDRVVSGVLAECGSDVDAAIRRLTQLRLEANGGQAGGDGGSSGVGAGGSDAGGSAGAAAAVSAPASEAGGEAAAAGAAAAGAKKPDHQPQTGEQWTEALVNEMAAARDLPDARGRASKLLAAFESFVSARRERVGGTAASTAPSTPTARHHLGGGGSSTPILQTPGGTARSADDLVRENAILKRAVQVQHARLQQVMQEGGGAGGGSGSGSGGGGAVAALHHQNQQQQVENEALRRALGECQQRVRALETTNYALALHLQRAAFGGGGDGGPGGDGGGGGGDGGGNGGGGGYYDHPFQPPPPPDVF